MTAPPPPFAARPATLDDAPAVAELIRVLNETYLGASGERVTAADVRDWWTSEDLERTSLLLHAPSGELAAWSFARLREDSVSFDSFVAPALVGQGLGSYLIEHAERLTREFGRENVHVATLAPDKRGRQLVESRGFRHLRTFFRMAIDLSAPPLEPVWPEGTTISSFSPGEERIYHDVHEESFEDHWGHDRRTFEDWSQRNLERASFEPSLWFLARVQGEPAGVVMCAHSFGIGWVDVLGVRRRWRRLGLGLALLRQGFRALYDAGDRRVGLSVDAASETGATRLYEREGMHVTWQADLWDKRI